MDAAGNYTPGDYVYRSYNPLKPGVVTAVLGAEHAYKVVVHFIDGQVETHPSYYVKSFATLIETTQRKLDTHKGKLVVLDEIKQEVVGS